MSLLGVNPVSSILNKYPCSKLGCSLPDLVCCSLTTGASTSTKVGGDTIQTEPQAGTSFDRSTIFKLEAETAKVAEQMLAQQERKKQAREQRQQQEQAREKRQQEKEEQEKEKRQQRQQWLTE